MRVTTFGMSAQYLNDLNTIMTNYQNTLQEAATGYKINQPSDNPVAFTADIQVQEASKQSKEWSSNAQSALSSMNIADSAISSLQSVLGGVRTSLVEATNGTNTPADLQNMAATVKHAIENVVQIANTSDGTQYIFAGTNGASKPLTGTIASGSTSGFTWGGNGKAQMTTIGNSVTLQVNTDLTPIFNGTSGSANLMLNLQNIYNDLSNNNQSALQTDLKNLDSNISNISVVQAGLGGRMSEAQSAQSQLSQMTTLFQNEQGKLQDANMAKVLTQLTQQQTVYTAALKAGAQMIMPTLATYI